MSAPQLSNETLAVFATENKQGTAYAVIISFTVLSFVAVCLRLFTRFFLVKKPGTEDYVIVVAMICSLVMAGFMIREVQFGLGRHITTITPAELEGVLWCVFGSILSYNISLTLTKISILLQYRRIFFVSERSNKVIHVVMVFTGLYGLECFFTGLLSCIPVRAFWDLKLQATAKCIPKFPLWFTNAAFNIATDLMIATIPLPVLRILCIPTKKKIALACIFCLGWVVCIVSFLRIHALIDMRANFWDFTWHTQETTYWSCVETNVGLVSACLPALNPLLSRLGISFGGSIQRGNAKGGSSSKDRGLLPTWLRNKIGSRGQEKGDSGKDMQNPTGDLVTIGHMNEGPRRKSRDGSLLVSAIEDEPELESRGFSTVTENDLTSQDHETGKAKSKEDDEF